MKIIQVVFCLFCAFGQSNDAYSQLKTGTGLQLSGTAIGLPDGLSVTLLSANNQGYKVQAGTLKNGQLQVNTVLPQPDIYVLMLTDPKKVLTTRYYQLFLDNEPVGIKINEKSSEPTITFGKTPLAFKECLSIFGGSFDTLTVLSKMRQSAGTYHYSLDSINFAWEQHKTYISKNTPSFLQKHKDNVVAAFLLNIIWPLFMDVSVAENWLGMLSPAGLNNPYGQYIASLVKNEKMFGYGQVAPDFVQNDTTGQPVSLKSFRGKYVLVDFWASWCGPCRQENPNLVNAFNTYKQKNFTILGVSLDREKPNWLKAIADDQLNWSHVSDLQYFQNEVAQLYKISSIPQNFLLDPEGRIIGKNLRGYALAEALEKTLGK